MASKLSAPKVSVFPSSLLGRGTIGNIATNKKNKVMKEKELFAAVYGIAELNREGFTFNINDNEMQATGYAVARKETQNSFGEAGLHDCIAFALANNVQCIGGWYDSESGKYYFDATEIFSKKDAAIDAGRRNGQIAIFDLNNLKEIRL